MKFVLAQRNFRNLNNFSGDSDTKRAIDMIEKNLKVFANKLAIPQLISIKTLKKIALNEATALIVINNYLAELCLVNNIKELKKLHNIKDEISPYKIKIYQEIIDMFSAMSGLDPSALTTLTILRKNDPLINSALEPTCKRKSFGNIMRKYY